jgi:hypothetical protein
MKSPTVKVLAGLFTATTYSANDAAKAARSAVFAAIEAQT